MLQDNEKVGVFIVGAPKAGTSTLYHFLDGHPDVAMSEIKEPNYFSSAETMELYSGTEFRHIHTSILSEEDYHKLFPTSRKLYGEASVSYLFYENVAERIKTYNSDAKIIICLRDPVERAFSHYQMDQRLGLTTKSFMESINTPESVEYQQYVLTGEYSKQVERYLNNFDEDNVLVIWFEDLKQKPGTVRCSLCEFLEIRQHEDKLGHKNSVKHSSNPLIMWVYRSALMRKLLKKTLPKNYVTRIKKNLFSSKSNISLAPDEESYLRDILRNDVVKLEQYLGKDLGHWM